MRDLALLGILPFLILFAFKKPFIGVAMWLWTASFSLNHMVFGFMQSIPYNKVFALITIISYLGTQKKVKVVLDSLSIFIALFLIWTLLSSIFSMNYASHVWARWEILFKIVLFYFFFIAIVEKKIHIDFVIWMLIVSIGALAAQEGLKFFGSLGGYRFAQLKQIEGDNNYFAIMIVTLMPLLFYLLSEMKSKWVRLGLVGVSILMAFGILATYSRGGFAGLLIVVFFLWTKSSKKFLLLMMLSLVIIVGLSIVPESYYNRINTVENIEEDSSFMGRIIAWKISTLIAMDNPALGGGFGAVKNLSIWLTYAQDFDSLDFIETPAPSGLKAKAAHSLYFQVLGDHGFVGLFIYLMMILIAFFKCSHAIYMSKKHQLDDWVKNLAEMLKLSLVLFCFTGGLVSVAYLDLIFAIFALIYVLDSRIIVEKLKEKNKIKINE